MGRTKGTPKTGGRKKGTPNAASAELRQRIEAFLRGNWEEAAQAWELVPDPKDKLRLYIELAKFVVPALQAVSVDATVERQGGSVEDDLKLLSGE